MRGRSIRTGPAKGSKMKDPRSTARNRLWQRAPLSCVLPIALCLPASAQKYSAEDIRDRHAVAFPVSRLQRDWIYQDHGLKYGDCFVDAKGNEVEQAMVRKVLAELEAENAAGDGLAKSLAGLVDARKPGNDPAWRSLYFRACEVRRKQRLKVFDDYPREFVYAKHFVFGDSQAMFAMTDHLTDAEGRYIRRLACDHGHTVFPHVMDDGRIIYTRWEYSDRTAGYLHSLFVMNPDGTNQTEFYGNNSQFPAALLHARASPTRRRVR